MKTAQNIFKTSFIYFVGQVSTKLISFLLLPIYTNYIQSADYGYYDYSLSLLSVVIPVIFMELWTGTLRFTLEQKDYEMKRKVVNNSAIIAMFCSAVYFILFWTAAFLLKFDLPVYIFIYSIFWMIQLFYLSIARAYGENALYASTGVISVLVNTVVTIATILIMDGAVETLYIGITVSYIVQILLIERKVHVFANFRKEDFDPVLCRNYVRFGIPLSINSVVYWLLEGFNKTIIVARLGESANGIYAIGNKLAGILNLFIGVFLLAWQETVYKIGEEDDKAGIYNSSMNNFIAVVGAGLVVMLPILHVLFPYIIGSGYAQAYGMLPFSLLAIYLNGVFGIIVSFFSAEKKTTLTLCARTTMAITNIVILFATIDVLNIYASLLALCVSNVVGIIINFFLVRRYLALKLDVKAIVLFVVMFTLSSLVYLYQGNLINIIWFVFTVCFYLFVLKDFIRQGITLVMSMLRKKAV